MYLEIFAPHCANPYEGIHHQIPQFICGNKISFDLHALLSLDVNCYGIDCGEFNCEEFELLSSYVCFSIRRTEF